MPHYREILPQMVSVSNNSQITQKLANVLAEKLDEAEFHDLKRWLQLVEQHVTIEKNRIKKFTQF